MQDQSPNQYDVWRVAVSMATDLMSIFSFSEFFNATASRLATLMNADGAALIVYDGPDQLRYKLFYGLEELNKRSIADFRFPASKGTVGRVLADGKPLFTPDYPSSPDSMREFVEVGMLANLVVPLPGPNGFVGAMAISWLHRQPKSLEASSLIVVGMFAALVGSALYREALEEQLERLSLHDPLTGLPNRRMLMLRLTEARERANRHQSAFAVAVIDLDGFKDVNDNLGHLAGDQALIKTANQIKTAIRATDMVGRLGGDEFLVILEDIKSPQEAESILARIGKVIETRFGEPGHTFDIRASIGATMYGNEQADPEALLRTADAAMYVSKRHGGNAVVFVESMGTALSRPHADHSVS